MDGHILHLFIYAGPEHAGLSSLTFCLHLDDHYEELQSKLVLMLSE